MAKTLSCLAKYLLFRSPFESFFSLSSSSSSSSCDGDSNDEDDDDDASTVSATEEEWLVLWAKLLQGRRLPLLVAVDALRLLAGWNID